MTHIICPEVERWARNRLAPSDLPLAVALAVPSGPSMKKTTIQLLLACSAAVTMLLAQTLVCSEVVFVKGGGFVNIKSLDCDFVTSSFVDRLCFDPKRSYMLALLKGVSYLYCGISPRTYRELITARSIGQYLNEHILG